ncbi:3431_t:CDS:2 [Diversispora eburnea]|uniref:3431_t:CDS:1 n=1 Tax=Diversispora eburnea TaxID=1213867 RepID=A0A9N8YWG0_9GLOM|nr:3431_t:CDS:2 [Diversispora eburnea]
MFGPQCNPPGGPPPATTATCIPGPPRGVDTSIPPEKRSFTQITSTEQNLGDGLIFMKVGQLCWV